MWDRRVPAGLSGGFAGELVPGARYGACQSEEVTADGPQRSGQFSAFQRLRNG